MKKSLFKSVAIFCLIIPLMTVLTACDGVFLFNNKGETIIDYSEYVVELENEIAELQGQIQNYVTATAQLNTEIISLQNQIAALIANKDDLMLAELRLKDEQIANLNLQISNLNETISTMTANALALQSQVDELSASNLTQAIQIESLTILINGYLSTIAGYENTVAQMQGLVTYLESIIPDITLRQDFLVTFYLPGGEIWDMQIVKDGSYVTMPIIPSGNWTFAGWNRGGFVVDPTLIKIIGDEYFYASINCQVIFMANGEQYGATQTVGLGNSLSIPNNPTSNKVGERFIGWSLNGTDVIDLIDYNVPHNTTLFAKFELLTVSPAVDSWETIGFVSDAIAKGDDPARFNYHVGDEKNITLSTNESITLQILGFNHDDKADGTGKTGITWGMKNLLSTTYRMNATNTNVGGWNSSELRNTVLSNLFNQLPDDLRLGIKQVTKLSTAGNASTNIVTSTDKLFLFSEVEIDGTTTATYADEGVQYQYWKTVKDASVGENRIKNLSNGTGSPNNWWLRAPSIANATQFRYFISTGGIFQMNTTSTFGICFGFAV